MFAILCHGIQWKYALCAEVSLSELFSGKLNPHFACESDTRQ
jgi:hypothetical protein